MGYGLWVTGYRLPVTGYDLPEGEEDEGDECAKGVGVEVRHFAGPGECAETLEDFDECPICRNGHEGKHILPHAHRCDRDPCPHQRERQKSVHQSVDEFVIQRNRFRYIGVLPEADNGDAYGYNHSRQKAKDMSLVSFQLPTVYHRNRGHRRRRARERCISSR